MVLLHVHDTEGETNTHTHQTTLARSLYRLSLPHFVIYVLFSLILWLFYLLPLIFHLLQVDFEDEVIIGLNKNQNIETLTLISGFWFGQHFTVAYLKVVAIGLFEEGRVASTPLPRVLAP